MLKVKDGIDLNDLFIYGVAADAVITVDDDRKITIHGEEGESILFDMIQDRLVEKVDEK